jgi:hypothetical protein
MSGTASISPKLCPNHYLGVIPFAIRARAGLGARLAASIRYFRQAVALAAYAAFVSVEE